MHALVLTASPMEVAGTAPQALASFPRFCRRCLARRCKFAGAPYASEAIEAGGFRILRPVQRQAAGRGTQAGLLCGCETLVLLDLARLLQARLTGSPAPTVPG